MSRYATDQSIKRGTMLGTANAFSNLRNRILTGELAATRIVIREGQRLDQIAFQQYNDGRMWWVIAAASGIGWCMQVPPGTVLTIPDPSVV